MKKVIYDCDNTFGLPNHDIDDGLTLLYLLGSSEIELLGVTLSHGNSGYTQVLQATEQMRAKLRLKFDYYGNAIGPGEINQSAVDFLLKTVHQNPGEITLVATGALTNIQQAQAQDPNFLPNVHDIVLMGGILKPLIVNGKSVSELNFSTDPKAARSVLLSGVSLTIMNGHLTAEAFFAKKDQVSLVQHLRGHLEASALNFFTETLTDWLAWNRTNLDFDGFCNWDITTAVYLEHSEFFKLQTHYLAEKQTGLATGQLQLSDHSPFVCEMPAHLCNLPAFNQLVERQLQQALVI